MKINFLGVPYVLVVLEEGPSLKGRPAMTGATVYTSRDRPIA